jgi:glutamine synthetase
MDQKGSRISGLNFVDLLGSRQQFSVARQEFDEKLFVHGIGVDASSIRGFPSIDECDTLMVPDIASAVVDPDCQVPTRWLRCDAGDPISGERCTRNPRSLAQRAEAYFKTPGIFNPSWVGLQPKEASTIRLRPHPDESFRYYHP